MNARLFRRRSRIGPWSALALVALVAAVGGGLWWGSRGSDSESTVVPVSTTADAGAEPSDSPGGVAERFLAAWSDQDWPALEGLAGAHGPRAAAAHEAWWSDLAVSSLSLDLRDVDEEAGQAVATYDVAVGVGDAGVWTYPTELELLLQGGKWVAAWQPTALHPSLAEGESFALEVRWGSRASIVDTSGSPLVSVEPAAVIGVVPNRIDSRATLAGALEENLGVTPAELDSILDSPAVQPDWFLPIRTVDRLAYTTLRPLLYPVPGVVFRVEERRGPAFAGIGTELLGTTGPITAELLGIFGSPYDAESIVGRSGLERTQEPVLAGTPTVAVVRSGPARPDLTVQEFPGNAPEPVRTTLSIKAQQAAELVVAGASEPAAIVVIDTANGQIRAAASTPLGGFNEALSGLFPPGSTFKIVVATALLESGLEPNDVIDCPVSVTVAGKEFRNATSLPRSLSLEQAFAVSCNTAFIELGTALAPEQLADVAARFGFGDTFAVGLPAASGDYVPADDAVEAAASIIGQGRVLASPLQMASVAATVASGKRFSPTLVPSGLDEATAEFSDEVMADLRNMMAAVVNAGTGKEAAVPGREVAGKTGTAQKGSGDDATTVAWFVGYSADLAFAVAVDGGASGSATAAPLAAAFLAELDEPSAPVGTLAACVEPGADWPTFQGSSSRSGCSAAPGLTDPELAWTSEAGVQAWLNTPIIIDDIVIVGSAGTRRAGPDDRDGIYAFELGDGSPLWEFSTGNDVNGVAGDADLLVATGDEGLVWGISPRDGSELWSFDVGVPVFGYPVFAGDVVVVGDALGQLWALDRTGAVVWRAELDGAIRGGPASDGRLIYAVSDLGDARAFNLDGFQMWSRRVELEGDFGGAIPVVYGPPTIVSDLLVVTYTVEGGPRRPGILAFDRYVGRLEWRGSDTAELLDEWGSVRSSAAAAGGRLILASSLSAGPQAIEPGSGETLWAGESEVSCGRQWASPVVMGDQVVLPRPDGAVYGFSLVNGSQVWRLPLPTEGFAVSLSDCVDADGFTVLEGRALDASAAIAGDGTIVVASSGQKIYAIRQASRSGS